MCDLCFQSPSGQQQPQHQSEVIALLTEIRDSLRPQPAAPSANDQAAMNIVRAVAQELLEAANALEAAAKRLKDDGVGFGASQAHKASLRARQAAEGLIG